MRSSFPLLLVALLALPAGARAAGYAINDQSARALGQGLAGVATLEGTETLFYNPAAADALRGWSLAAGMTRLSLDVSATPLEDGLKYESSRDHFDVPHLYLVRGGLGAKQRWALGLSVNAP